VKTSTGFHASGGATVADVRLMRAEVGPRARRQGLGRNPLARRRARDDRCRRESRRHVGERSDPRRDSDPVESGAMGTLRSFNLQPFMEQFGCRYLFETGTGIGDGLAYAAYYAFERLWSVEIHPEVAATARDRFVGDPRIQILEQTSEDALSALLPTIDRGKPILFWLDAHFPGADFGYASYKDETNLERRLPLERELALIGKLRHPSAT
jgi:hypothetical protein